MDQQTQPALVGNDGEASAPAVPHDAAIPRWRWAKQIPRDVILIVLGALLAFAAEEWRDARQRRSRVSTALMSIRDELRANLALVTRAREHHMFLADTLGKLASQHLQPSIEIYANGMFNPAIVTNSAWHAARETGALGDIPLAVVLAIAPAYEAQDRYNTLANAMGNAIMMDVRRDGMMTVLRDRFAQFIELDIDFSNREGVLLEEYRKALKKLR
jgi:hypothetical protein